MIHWHQHTDSATRGMAQALLLATRAKDPLTFSHCVRVGRMGRLLAQAAGMSEWEQAVAEFAGQMHDIGKIGVPDEILYKPGRLLGEEKAVMEAHAEESARLVTPLVHAKIAREALPVILHHHEHVNGEGYPHGLREPQIPTLSKVILVVDTFDAMTADRVYRRGLPPEVAFTELKKYSGVQFDRELVKIFLQAQRFWSQGPLRGDFAKTRPPYLPLTQLVRAA